MNRPTGRKVTDAPPALNDAQPKPRSIYESERSDTVPHIVRYAFRSFDLQHVIADARLLDRASPALWLAHSEDQVYMTSLLTDVLGSGPAATVSSELPDLHHFRGRGAKDVIPLYRDEYAIYPNVTEGVIDNLRDAFGRKTFVEWLFIYAYGILAQPAYVDRFWDELELPPPRLPITKNPDLFNRVAVHGSELIYLHTYGERFGSIGADGLVPQGIAGCDGGVSKYPESYEYDRINEVLRVGDGVFAPVKSDVWDYSVSGMQVVKSWLDRRSLRGSGKKSSPLDEIRPERWDFTEELLELLWVLEHTIELQPVGAALLDEVCKSELFSASELPKPTAAERKAPNRTEYLSGQGELSSYEGDSPQDRDERT